jgi:protein-tyrosine-phosphatase
MQSCLPFSMPSILFVCTANQFCSPLAVACFLKTILKERAAEMWNVESAGTWTKDGMPAAKIAIQTARQIGVYSLQSHRTRQIHRDLIDAYDLVIVMERGQKEALCIEFPSVGGRLYLLSEIVDGAAYDIPDPGERGVQASEVARELFLLITRGKEKILQLAKLHSKRAAP